MFRNVIVIALIVVSIGVYCNGQTFQYSRGWTNGKRSATHFHEDPSYAASEIIDMDTEKRLENCLLNLQRLIRSSFMFNRYNQGHSIHHSSPESNNNDLLIDELNNNVMLQQPDAAFTKRPPPSLSALA